MSIRPYILSFLLCLAVTAGCSAKFPAPTGPSQQVSFQVLYEFNGTEWPAPTGLGISFRTFNVDADGGWTERLGSALCTSSNVAVARVLSSQTCNAFGVGPGTATVNATYGTLTGSTDVAFVTRVYPALRAVWLPGPRTLPFRGTMEARIYSDANTWRDVTGGATWSSSDTGIATMSGNSFTGLVPGNVEITATVDGQTARYRIGVAPKNF